MALAPAARAPADTWETLPFEMELSEEEWRRAASGVHASCMEEKWNVVPRTGVEGGLLFLRS